MVHASLENLFDSSLDPARRDLVNLPLKLGGLGIPKASFIAMSAFLGGYFDSFKLQNTLLKVDTDDIEASPELLGLVTRWNACHRPSADITLPELITHKKVQQWLTSKVHEQVLERLKTVEVGLFPKVLRGNLLSGGALWTDVVPSPQLNQTMDSGAFRAALRFRLGLHQYPSNVKCDTCRRKNADILGIHTSICPGIHHQQHNVVRDVLMSATRQAQMNSEREPPGLLQRIGRPHDRPADIYLPDYRMGRGLCVDVSIVSSYGHAAVPTPGHQASLAVKRKRDQYDDACRRCGMDFQPFVMETMGGFHSECDNLLKTIGRKLSELSGSSPVEATRRLQARLSFRWARELGNAILSQRRVNSFRVVHGWET